MVFVLPPGDLETNLLQSEDEQSEDEYTGGKSANKSRG